MPQSQVVRPMVRGFTRRQNRLQGPEIWRGINPWL